MRNYRSSKGPVQERPFFQQQEIEDLCQEELRSMSLLPSTAEPVRIERFIEKRFGITPIYEELPPGVLGFTRFTTAGVEAIVVSRALAEEESKTAERRINTTLAHEAGHGLLHTYLFAVGAQPERLFGDEFDPKVPRILCRDDTANSFEKPRYDGRWWEFQANQTIGALLLPKFLVEKALDATILGSVGTFGLRQLKLKDRGRAARVLSEAFNVNPAVAKIRLDQLFPEADSAQLSL
jgi:hypothetical protein